MFKFYIRHLELIKQIFIYIKTIFNSRWNINIVYKIDPLS